MSATLNAEAFAEYFHNPPPPLSTLDALPLPPPLPVASIADVAESWEDDDESEEEAVDVAGDQASNRMAVASVHIPGFTYPVEDHYLEDALQLISRVPHADTALVAAQQAAASQSARGKGGGGGRRAGRWEPDEGGGEEAEAAVAEAARMAARMAAMVGAGVGRDVAWACTEGFDEEDRRHGVMAALVVAVDATEGDGAVLVFVPGWDDISKVHAALSASGASSRLQLHALHGAVPSAQQRAVFDRPPAGQRK
eukprot:3037546-Prymnesium_polylepis.1